MAEIPAAVTPGPFSCNEGGFFFFLMLLKLASCTSGGHTSSHRCYIVPSDCFWVWGSYCALIATHDQGVCVEGGC